MQVSEQTRLKRFHPAWSANGSLQQQLSTRRRGGGTETLVSGPPAPRKVGISDPTGLLIREQIKEFALPLTSCWSAWLFVEFPPANIHQKHDDDFEVERIWLKRRSTPEEGNCGTTIQARRLAKRVCDSNANQMWEVKQRSSFSPVGSLLIKSNKQQRSDQLAVRFACWKR